MQHMQSSEVLHLLGNFSGCAGSWDVFRGRWHHTAISGILLWRGDLSRAGWGCFLCVFLLLLRFSVPAGSTILNRTFRIFHRNFVIFVRRLLDVTCVTTRSRSGFFMLRRNPKIRKRERTRKSYAVLSKLYTLTHLCLDCNTN